MEEEALLVTRKSLSIWTKKVLTHADTVEFVSSRHLIMAMNTRKPYSVDSHSRNTWEFDPSLTPAQFLSCGSTFAYETPTQMSVSSSYSHLYQDIYLCAEGILLLCLN